MKNTCLIVLAVLLVILSIPLGILISKQYVYFSYISESYDREITLAEEIVLDDELTLFFHDNPVVLKKGDKGHIHDEVNSQLGDEVGEAYINARFSTNDGDYISVSISTDIESDDSPAGTVIDINKLESSQTILEEYKQSRERYHTKVRNSQITVTAIFVAIAVVIAAIVLMASKLLVIEEKSNTRLIGVLIVLVIVVIVGIVFCLYLNL